MQLTDGSLNDHCSDPQRDRRNQRREALAFAFGAGIVGGLTYWLLVVRGAVPGTGFAYVFAAMLLAQSAGVLIGRRKYS